MRRARRLLLVFACASLLALGRVATRALRSARFDAPVVYLRDTKAGAEVALQQGKSVRVLHEATDSLGAFGVPDDLGLLPSPDGRALLIWESVTSQADPETATTLWSVLDVGTGRESTFLEEAEPSPPLPRWDGPGRVVLAGENADYVTSISGGAAQPALRRPRPGHAQPSRDQQTRRLAAYANALLHGVTWKQMREATAAAGVNAHDYYGHDEDPWRWVTRTCGVPVSDAVDDPSASPVQAAVSPGGRYLAITDIYQTRVTVIEWGRRTAGRPYAWGDRLTVIDLQTGATVWRTEVPPRANPEHTHLPPYVMPNPGPEPTLDPDILDVRWSPDGRYLSFTVDYSGDSEVRVVDARTWAVVLRVPDARDAFVLLASKRGAGGTG